MGDAVSKIDNKKYDYVFLSERCTTSWLRITYSLLQNVVEPTSLRNVTSVCDYKYIITDDVNSNNIPSI